MTEREDIVDDQRMSTEHMIELVTARVMLEERTAWRWRLGFLVALIGVIGSGAGFILTRESEGYSDEAVKRLVRNLDTATPIATPVTADRLEAGNTVERNLADNEVWRLLIPADSAAGNRRYRIEAIGVGDFDPVIGLYRVTEQTRPSLLAFNDDFEDSVNSRIFVQLQGPVEYELRVHEFSGRPGQVMVSLESG